MTGRRERRKRDTRQTLLRAGLSLFADRGVYATRVEDITDRADLGKGAFYNYFDSKQALAAALITEAVELLRRDYFAAAASAANSSERVEAIARAHVLFFEENVEYAKLFHQARGLIEIRDESSDLRAAFGEYLEAVGDALIPRVLRDRLSASDVTDLAALVAGAIAGYRSFRVVLDCKPHPSTLVGLLAGGFTAVLEARDGQFGGDGRAVQPAPAAASPGRGLDGGVT